MQKYRNNIQDQFGNWITGATIEVRDVVGGALSAIFSDDGVTPLSNPFVEPTSEFRFYAANGRYDITISGPADDTIPDVLLNDPAGGVAVIPDGTIDGQMLLWDETFDLQYETSLQLTIEESAAAGGSINFYGAGAAKTEFMRWSATDGGVVHIFEPTLRLQDSTRIDLWPVGLASRPFIRGLSGSSYLEFTAENTGALINTGAIFRYPISTQALSSPPNGILGDTNMLWSYQFNSSAGTVLLTMNEDDIVFPVGAPVDQVWTFNSPTAAANPGAKFMRMNTADFATAGAFYFGDQSAMEPDAGWWFSLLNPGDILAMTTGVNRGKWCYARVDTITDNTGWWTIEFTVIEHAGTNFVNADDVRINVIRASVASNVVLQNAGLDSGNVTLGQVHAGQMLTYNSATARSLLFNDVAAIKAGSMFALKVGPSAGVLTGDGGTGVQIRWWNGSGWTTTAAAGNITIGVGDYNIWKETDTLYHINGPTLS